MPGQVYSVSSLGGNHSVPYLSERLRSLAQPMFRFRQFVDVKEQIGLNRGDTWLFDKTGNVATQGGTLVETNTIPETQFVTNQGTGTIAEYGNSIPWTAKLDKLGQFQISPLVEQKLRDDMVKVLESACAAQFVATEYVGVCVTTASAAITTNGTATASATSNLTAYNIRQFVDFFKKRNIPKYDGSNYIMVASTAALSGMHADVASGGWNDISKYTAEYAKNLHSGEVGAFYGVRFVEETGYLSNTIGNSSIYGQAVMFGSDNVYEAVTVPEEIRVKNSTDYGRDLGMAWYALLGWKKVWDFSVDAEQHIMFITSA
jgi:N4-gp56 family major capsid protein